MMQLIAARALAGVGGGGMMVVVSILLSDVVSLRERGKYQGYVRIADECNPLRLPRTSRLPFALLSVD